LPVPAPAKIKTGPFSVSAARSCWGFNELRFNIANVYGAENFLGQEQSGIVKNFFAIGNLTGASSEIRRAKSGRNPKEIQVGSEK
jgi:hypothetical protein